MVPNHHGHKGARYRLGVLELGSIRFDDESCFVSHRLWSKKFGLRIRGSRESCPGLDVFSKGGVWVVYEDV